MQGHGSNWGPDASHWWSTSWQGDRPESTRALRSEDVWRTSPGSRGWQTEQGWRDMDRESGDTTTARQGARGRWIIANSRDDDNEAAFAAASSSAHRDAMEVDVDQGFLDWVEQHSHDLGLVRDKQFWGRDVDGSGAWCAQDQAQPTTQQTPPKNPPIPPRPPGLPRTPSEYWGPTPPPFQPPNNPAARPPPVPPPPNLLPPDAIVEGPGIGFTSDAQRYTAEEKDRVVHQKTHRWQWESTRPRGHYNLVATGKWSSDSGPVGIMSAPASSSSEPRPRPQLSNPFHRQGSSQPQRLDIIHTTHLDTANKNTQTTQTIQDPAFTLVQAQLEHSLLLLDTRDVCQAYFADVRLCVACAWNEPTEVTHPCNHLALCVSCLNSLVQKTRSPSNDALTGHDHLCPVCHEVVTGTTHVVPAGYPSKRAHGDPSLGQSVDLAGNPRDPADAPKNHWVEAQERDEYVTRRFQRYGVDYVPGQFLKKLNSSAMETEPAAIQNAHSTSTDDPGTWV